MGNIISTYPCQQLSGHSRILSVIIPVRVINNKGKRIIGCIWHWNEIFLVTASQLWPWHHLHTTTVKYDCCARRKSWTNFASLHFYPIFLFEPTIGIKVIHCYSLSTENSNTLQRRDPRTKININIWERSFCCSGKKSYLLSFLLTNESKRCLIIFG